MKINMMGNRGPNIDAVSLTSLLSYLLLLTQGQNKQTVQYLHRYSHEWKCLMSSVMECDQMLNAAILYNSQRHESNNSDLLIK